MSTSAAAASKLFKPYRVGDVTLSHRVVMAPLTRYRADDQHVHHDVAVEYYRQRSIVPGTLLISEAVFISKEASGYPNIPGIYEEEQIRTWTKITDAVHKNKSFIAMQLWALGRAAKKDILDAYGFPFVSSSDIPIKYKAKQGNPRPLTGEEVRQYIKSYATAAQNAIKAGFDMVEIHGTNGYLVDQFIQDTANRRTDEWGGSIENRARFAIEVVKAISDAVGQSRTAIRLGPWVSLLDMRMKDPIPTFSYLIRTLKERFPDLAYLHLIEPAPPRPGESNDFAREIWKGKPLISAGFSLENAIQTADETDTAIAFGKWFISNPDLPDRIKNNLPLTPFDEKTFYTRGPDKVEGYTNYPLTNIPESRL